MKTLQILTLAVLCLNVATSQWANGQRNGVRTASLFQEQQKQPQKLSTSELPQQNAKVQNQQKTFRIQGQDNLADLITFYRNQKKLQLLVTPAQQTKARSFEIYVDPNHEFPENALDDLVLQLLRLNDQALVPVAGKKGWMQIVSIQEVRPYAELLLKEGDRATGPYATKVFRLKHISNTDFRDRIEPFLARLSPENSTGRNSRNNQNSQIKGNVIYLDKWNTILITDLVSNLNRTKRLLARLDIPPESIAFQQIPIHHQPAKRVAGQLRKLMANNPAERNKNANATTEKKTSLVIEEDRIGSRILIRGTRTAVLEAAKLVEQLDVVTDATQTYVLNHVSSKEFQSILNNRFGKDDESSVRIEARADNRTLIVTAPKFIHQQIGQLIQSFDKKAVVSAQNSRLKTYPVKNRQASEILETIQGIGGQRSRNRGNASRGVSTRGISSIPTNQFGGPGGFRETEQTRERNAIVDRAIDERTVGFLDQQRRQTQRQEEERSRNSTQSILERAFVTLDDANNTIIVDAEPEVQALYADLIKKLDRKRPQVLIEVSVVSITSLEDTSLGIEVSAGDRTGTNRSFTFSQFGLSSANASNGVLTLSPGVGFNGAILKPDVADVILRSLAQHERAKVVSAPRILVRDNATGTLSSVAEIPFAGLNSGQNFSSTTLQGFAEAGTTITVSPQISEANHLNITFDVLVNDFTGDAAQNLPPPRQSNQVTSEVAIPDGHTVIVGGLTRERFSKVHRGIPFLEKIPVVRLLGGNVSDNESSDRLFVFIRPIILRDDQFKDLIQYTSPATRKSKANDGFPKSRPRMMYPKR